MKTEVLTIRPDRPIAEALELFDSNQFHHLPVVSESGTLDGILSSTDIAKATKQFAAGDLEQKTVQTLMSTSVLSIEPDDTVGLAADIFLSNKLHALPILDDGMLVGIVTAHDLLAYAFADAFDRETIG